MNVEFLELDVFEQVVGHVVGPCQVGLFPTDLDIVDPDLNVISKHIVQELPVVGGEGLQECSSLL